MIKEVEDARKAYLPEPNIRCLLIAEAPPSAPNRFFYYDKGIQNGDSLFLETMKVFYETHRYDPKVVRANKQKLLERFKEDGFYLIDASTNPIPQGTKGRKKQLKLKESLDDLIARLMSLRKDGLLSSETPIILISATVYNVCRARLIAEGFKVNNNVSVHFPSSGNQKNFRNEMQVLRVQLGITPVDVLADRNS